MTPSIHVSISYIIFAIFVFVLLQEIAKSASIFTLLFELSSTFRYHFFFSYLLKRNYQFDDFYKIIEYD